VFELLDPTKIIEVPDSAMASASRGCHFHVALAPLWNDTAHDVVCRQWARDVAQMLKAELERGGAEMGQSEDGWIGKRGEHGAKMVYGTMTVSVYPATTCFFMSSFQRQALTRLRVRREVQRRVWYELRAPAGAQRETRFPEHVQQYTIKCNLKIDFHVCKASLCNYESNLFEVVTMIGAPYVAV
jgi:hypothetical protein